MLNAYHPRLLSSTRVLCGTWYVLITTSLPGRLGILTLHVLSSLPKVHTNFQRSLLTIWRNPSGLFNFILFSCPVRFPLNGFQILQIVQIFKISMYAFIGMAYNLNGSLLFTLNPIFVYVLMGMTYIFIPILLGVHVIIVSLTLHTVRRPVNMYRPTSQASWSSQSDDMK